MQSWTDERLDQVINVFATHLTAISNAQVNLVESQADLAKSQARHEDSLVILYESVRDIRQNLVELRAGQERQERILDYLIRQEGKNP